MSDIKEIKPHDKPEEYNFEDYPVPATDRNRVSAIFMNWVKSKLLSLPYIVESGVSNGTYFEKWSDGKLRMVGYIDRKTASVTTGYAINIYKQDFNFPINPINDLSSYLTTIPILYNGIGAYHDYEAIYTRIGYASVPGGGDFDGTLRVVKTAGSWSANNRRFGLSWELIAKWK